MTDRVVYSIEDSPVGDRKKERRDQRASMRASPHRKAFVVTMLKRDCSPRQRQKGLQTPNDTLVNKLALQAHILTTRFPNLVP